MNQPDFDFDAGALCLDFANTADWHAREEPDELLNDIFDLIAWGEAAELLTAEESEQLTRQAKSDPQRGVKALEKGIDLREALYRLFSSQALDQTVNPHDLAILNHALHDCQGHQELVPAEGGFAWEWVDSPVDFGHIFRPVARSAADLLTSDQLDRVSRCADDRGCGYLFVDTSRNRSRRWCSMESCGNRAKARRHYHRQQEE